MKAYTDGRASTGPVVQEYEVLNELIDYSNRKDENCLKHTRFLFEFDDIPLTKQAERINDGLDKLIVRAVFSGSKSIHLVVEFSEDCEDMCKTWYKQIWNYLEQTYFTGADKQCKNPARLTRTPNFIRSDNGALQKLLINKPSNYIDKAVPDLLTQLRMNIRAWQSEDAMRKFKSEEIKKRFIKTNHDGMCKTYTTVKRYLDTPFPKVKGNGVSSAWLFAAVCTCIKYCDSQTLDEVLMKARREHWRESELNHLLEGARNRQER